MPRKRPAPPEGSLVKALKELFPAWDGRKPKIPSRLVRSVDEDGRSTWDKALNEVCNDK